MKSRLTVRLYNNTLSNAFKSMGSHLCTKIFFLGTLFFTNNMRLHFCISDWDRQGFHVDMIIVILVFIFILPLLNKIIVFSR